GVVESQLPPLALTAVALKVSAVLLLDTVIVCGFGSIPRMLEKLKAGSCTNTGSPTVTTTGMLVLPLELCSRTWPTKWPAITPPPGSLRVLTEMLRLEGAVPFLGEMVSHVPPSAVVLLPVHVSVPPPPFKIWIDCAGGLLVLGTNENVASP